jgi:hypothetical protein
MMEETKRIMEKNYRKMRAHVKTVADEVAKIVGSVIHLI